MLSKSEIAEVVKNFALKVGDTASPEVQVALLTKRIEHLTPHFEKFKKDFSSKRGLMRLIGQRRSLLKYLSNKSPERYQSLIGKLGLRK